MKKSKMNYQKRKNLLRCICVLLSLVFSLAAFPSSAIALPQDDPTEPSVQGLDGVASSSEQELVEVMEEEVPDSYTGGVTELVSMREENVKHFKLTDGTYEAISYGTAVHRKNANGEWKDIDNTLTLRRSGESERFATEDARVSFAKAYSPQSPLFALNENGYSISMRLLADAFSSEKEEASRKDAASASAVEATVSNVSKRREETRWETIEEAARIENKSVIRYAGIKENTDIEYVLEGNDIKENIIVKDRREAYVYSFALLVTGLNATLTKSGEILFTDAKTGESKYSVPAPYMFDSNRDFSYAVKYVLSGNATDGYRLQIVADADWINDESRVFPVTIDPTVITTSDGLMDTHIYSSYPNNNYSSSETLWVSSTRTTLIKIDPPSLPSGATVNYAMLHASYYYMIDDGSLTATAYQVLQDFNYNTVTWATASAYTNCGISTAPLGYAIMYASPSIREATPGEAQFEITEAVENWYDSPYSNYGVAIKFSSGPNGSVILKSEEAGDGHIPYLRVAYTHVFPDGVYAFKNADSATRFMTMEAGKKLSGAYIQQKEITGSHPALTFERESLFKISNIPNTEYYIIRSMVNNTLSLTVSGTTVKTKLIPGNDEDVSLQDAFLITWAGDGFYIRHAYSGKLINMVSTSTQNLNAIAVGSATNKSVWYPLQYSGADKTGLSYYGGTTALAGTTVEYTPLPYSTVINRNEPYMHVNEESASIASGVWDSTNFKFSVTFQFPGTAILNFQIRTAGSPTNYYFINVSVLFDDGIIHTLKNVSTDQLIHPNNESSGSSIVQSTYSYQKTTMMWMFEYVANGYYKIKNDVTGLYLTAPANNSENAPIVQSADSGNYSLWKFSKSGNNYKIQSKNQAERTTSSPLYLAISGSSLVQSSTLTNNTWIVKPLIMRMNILYDQSFKQRFPDYMSLLHSVYSENSVGLSISAVFKERFGILVKVTYPGADDLYNSYPYTEGCQYASNIDTLCKGCGSNEEHDLDDIHACDAGVHHKSELKLLESVNKSRLHESEYTNILFSGFATCYPYIVRDEEENIVMSESYHQDHAYAHGWSNRNCSGILILANTLYDELVEEHSFDEIIKTISHETLHTLGAVHCTATGLCIMQKPSTVATENLSMCDVCLSIANQNKFKLYYHQ